MQENANTTAYTVHTPLVAQTRDQDGRIRFVAIPRGSVLTVSGDSLDIGLLDVDCNGRKLSVFSRDIQERAHRLPDY